VEAKQLDLERKDELLTLLLVCLSNGPKTARKQRFRVLARPLVNEIIAFAMAKTGGRIRPMKIGLIE
jgi:hypothetical protein